MITLQTAALLCNPSEIPGPATAAQLHEAYKLVWDDLSERSLVLSHFFACQSLAGGRYLHERFRPDEPYSPWLLTEPGSVFVFTVNSGKESLVKEKLKAWLAGGLPLPAWANQQHQRPGQALWETCPFVPENGWGEIAVNLDVHMSLQPPSASLTPS